MPHGCRGWERFPEFGIAVHRTVKQALILALIIGLSAGSALFT